MANVIEIDGKKVLQNDPKLHKPNAVERLLKWFDDQGYKVELEHERYGTAPGWNAKGGTTFAHVYQKGEYHVLTAKAVCSEKDNYDKRLGAVIALGRAKSELSGERKRREDRDAEYTVNPQPFNGLLTSNGDMDKLVGFSD